MNNKIVNGLTIYGKLGKLTFLLFSTLSTIPLMFFLIPLAMSMEPLATEKEIKIVVQILYFNTTKIFKQSVAISV